MACPQDNTITFEVNRLKSFLTSACRSSLVLCCAPSTCQAVEASSHHRSCSRHRVASAMDPVFATHLGFGGASPRLPSLITSCDRREVNRPAFAHTFQIPREVWCKLREEEASVARTSAFDEPGTMPSFS